MATKTLIAVFSRTGITKSLARAVAVKAGADIFPINPAKDYPSNYLKCVFVAKMEQIKDAKPLIMGKPQNLDRYDNIILMSPIWWNTFPRIILTFLEENNLQNKNILPVCTHGGGGKGHVDEDLKLRCNNKLLLPCIDATALKQAAVKTIAAEIEKLNE